MSGRATIARGWQGVKSRAPVLAIGNFDGVHIGHQALLRHARQSADALGAPLLVVSFFPPAKVFFGAAQYLSSEREKQLLLQASGADEVLVIPFDASFATTTAESFIALLANLAPQLLVVGEDFRFGQNRSGDIAQLKRAFARVDALPLVSNEGELVKSSSIREALQRGDTTLAARLLGRPYLVVGEVVTGDRRGRTLGWPTANLARTADKALPLGVFAVWVDTPAGRMGGMANVGPRPTYPDAQPLLEAHLFDVDLNLYGAEIAVHVLTRLRTARKFNSLDDLKAQLALDALAARNVLTNHALAATPELPGLPRTNNHAR